MHINWRVVGTMLNFWGTYKFVVLSTIVRSMYVKFMVTAVCLLTISGCSPSSSPASNSTGAECADFESSAAKLKKEIPGSPVIQPDYLGNPLPATGGGTPREIAIASLTYAHFYADDTTGCASVEDKAKAKTDIDLLNEQLKN